MTKAAAAPARRHAAHHDEPVDDTPTPEQAKKLFEERADCMGILTTEGWMKRDGTIEASPAG